jgi:esterase
LLQENELIGCFNVPMHPRLGLYSSTVGLTGKRVIFLHGLFGRGRNWATTAAGLRDEYRVTMVDMPNHGRSAWTERFSYPEMAACIGQLIEELCEKGNHERVTIVGHSMGGKVAMMLALLRPDLVESLVVVDIAPVRYEQIGHFATYIQGMQTLDLDGLADRRAADTAMRAAVPHPAIRAFLLQNLRREHDEWHWQLNIDLIEERLAQLGDWPGVDDRFYAGRVLSIAGQDSDYVTGDATHAMRRLFPQARRVTIKNGGHWVHSEQPATFIGTLRAFLAAPQ